MGAYDATKSAAGLYAAVTWRHGYLPASVGRCLPSGPKYFKKKTSCLAGCLADFWRQKKAPEIRGLKKDMAEEVRFELTEGCPSAVFKTAAFSRSATPPSLRWRFYMFVKICQTNFTWCCGQICYACPVN